MVPEHEHHKQSARGLEDQGLAAIGDAHGDVEHDVEGHQLGDVPQWNAKMSVNSNSN